VFDPAVLDGSAVRVRWDLLPARLHRWTAAAFPIDARRAGIDVFLGPDYLLPLRGAPAVLVVNDLSFYRYPGSVSEPVLARLRRDFPRSAARAARLVTPSEFSRREVLELLAPGEARVATIPWAPPPGMEPASEGEIEDFCRRRGLERGYLLAVGSLQLHRALRAFLAGGAGGPRRARPTSFWPGNRTTWPRDRVPAGAVARLETAGKSAPRSAAGRLPSARVRAAIVEEPLAAGSPLLSSCPGGGTRPCVDPNNPGRSEGIEQVLTDQALRSSPRGFERARRFSFRGKGPPLPRGARGRGGRVRG
jgi:hypothetical protein